MTEAKWLAVDARADSRTCAFAFGFFSRESSFNAGLMSLLIMKGVNKKQLKLQQRQAILRMHFESRGRIEDGMPERRTVFFDEQEEGATICCPKR